MKVRIHSSMMLSQLCEVEWEEGQQGVSVRAVSEPIFAPANMAVREQSTADCDLTEPALYTMYFILKHQLQVLDAQIRKTTEIVHVQPVVEGGLKQ